MYTRVAPKTKTNHPLRLPRTCRAKQLRMAPQLTAWTSGYASRRARTAEREME